MAAVGQFAAPGEAHMARANPILPRRPNAVSVGGAAASFWGDCASVESRWVAILKPQEIRSLATRNLEGRQS